MNFRLSDYPCINLNHFELPLCDCPKEVLCDSTSQVGTKAITPSENSTTDSDTDIYCRRCGRKLKDSQSRILGMGPTCYKQHQLDRNRQINLLYCCEGNYNG